MEMDFQLTICLIEISIFKQVSNVECSW